MIECLRMVLDKVGQPLSRPRFALAFEFIGRHAAK